MRAFASFVAFCFSLCITSPTFAQAVSPDVNHIPLVRLTGVLEVVKDPPLSTFPVVRVWVDESPRVFRIARVEPVFSAYRADEDIRRVSPLGLRFLADKKTLALLQTPEMHDRSIVIEGWLQPKRGILRVRSVHAVEQ